LNSNPSTAKKETKITRAKWTGGMAHSTVPALKVRSHNFKTPLSPKKKKKKKDSTVSKGKMKQLNSYFSK
jgi:hypothetical protein